MLRCIKVFPANRSNYGIDLLRMEFNRKNPTKQLEDGFESCGLSRSPIMVQPLTIVPLFTNIFGVSTYCNEPLRPEDSALFYYGIPVRHINRRQN